MEPKIITADEAKALTAKWRGYDGPYGVSWDDEGDCVVHYDDMTVARVAHFDGGHTEPLARLFAAAPDDVKSLAHTIIAQTAELAALRAIIDGRTIPPTDKEIEAHHRAGGTWYVASTHGRALTTTRADAVALCAHLAANKYPATWWAISVRGRPCAWPVVAPKGGV